MSLHRAARRIESLAACMVIAVTMQAALLLAGLSVAGAASAQPDAKSTPHAPRTLRVGPGHELPLPSSAAELARDGDTIEIQAGTYPGDVAIWRAHNLTIRGVGGRARLVAQQKHAEGKAIWVIKGNNTTVENIEFHEARVPDRNGAGIRQEGAGLTVRNCLFANNENGILTGENRASDILIEASEFALNGNDTGLTHNLYVGTVRSLTVRHSWFRNARGGHGIKSRAERNLILHNRIADDADGTTAYEVEFPNGGIAVLVGNVIRQSPRTANFTLVSFGVEGRRAVNELYAFHNTLISNRPAGARFFWIRGGTDVALIENNVWSGRGDFLTGEARTAGNVELRATDFVNAAELDFRPLAAARVAAATASLGKAAGVSLLPGEEYRHPLAVRRRADADAPVAGALAIGAR